MSTEAKEIIFEEEAREALLRGIKTLADVITCTLGPKGCTVGLERPWGAPSITSDSTSIVKDLEVKDPFVNMGLAMAKQVVEKIKEACGDGTTTGVLILRSIVEEGIKQIATGTSPINIKRGIDQAVTAIVKEIEKNAIPVKDNNDIKNIATVAASGNEEVGRIIAEAINSVGTSGVVTVEEAKGTETSIEVVEGMQFDRGYISPYFCTDSEKRIATMQDAKVLLVDKRISNIHELLPLLQSIAAAGQELLLIAEDVEGDVLSTLVVNRLRGTLKVVAVKAPGFGERRKALLEDIAVLTGATVVSEDVGISLQEADPEVLGSVEKVTISKDHCTIINGGGNPDAVSRRIQQIEHELANTTSSYDREKLQERKAKIAGGVAVIRVGAATEPELKENKRIFEDSLNSTNAAIEKGVVPGGGVALLRAANSIHLEVDEEQRVGVELLQKACRAPVKQLVVNSGLDGSVIASEVANSKGAVGFNILTGKLEDLEKAHVMDPAKVLITALSYAASAAGIVLLSEALMSEVPDEEEE